MVPAAVAWTSCLASTILILEKSITRSSANIMCVCFMFVKLIIICLPMNFFCLSMSVLYLSMFVFLFFNVCFMFVNLSVLCLLMSVLCLSLSVFYLSIYVKCLSVLLAVLSVLCLSKFCLSMSFKFVRQVILFVCRCQLSICFLFVV